MTASRPSLAPLIGAPRPCDRPTAPGRCGPAARRDRDAWSSRRPAAASGTRRGADPASPAAACRCAPACGRGAAAWPPRPTPQAQPVEQRRVAGGELRLAPVPHQARQRDLHRAHLLAAPAEGRGVGQVAGIAHADQRRGEHRADRARIDPAVGMAADRRIDRAVVHAGAAADAAQHLAELARPAAPTRPLSRMTIWQASGPSGSLGAPGAGRERRVGRDLLARGRARQQANERAHVLQGRHHLLDGGQHDVHLGQRLGEVAVALVGDDHRGAGLGDQEIGAGDADVGGEELLRAGSGAPRRPAAPARSAGGPPAAWCAGGGSRPRPGPG